jgi:hypothetical protein
MFFSLQTGEATHLAEPRVAASIPREDPGTADNKKRPMGLDTHQALKTSAEIKSATRTTYHRKRPQPASIVTPHEGA